MSSSTLFELKKSPMNFCIVFRGALTKQQKLIESISKCKTPIDVMYLGNLSLSPWKIHYSFGKLSVLKTNSLFYGGNLLGTSIYSSFP
jgi:hypothetical protein